jgi:hypothetical protein
MSSEVDTISSAVEDNETYVKWSSKKTQKESLRD